jgi:hypothetical protein
LGPQGFSTLNFENCMDNRVEYPLGIFKKLIIKIENEKQK